MDTADLQVVALSLNGVEVHSATASTLLTPLTPDILSDTDGRSYEMGMEFQPRVDGLINALRFFKSPDETGLHVGRLWSTSGALLATVTFEAETTSGWQEAALPAPLAVQANSSYLVTVGINEYYVITLGVG